MAAWSLYDQFFSRLTSEVPRSANLLIQRDTVIVSTTGGPGSAYSPREAEAYVYRKTGERWEQSMSGLPAVKGTTVSHFATHAHEPGVVHAANNRGLFRSW
jgi:hypothetical protein